MICFILSLVKADIMVSKNVQDLVKKMSYMLILNKKIWTTNFYSNKLQQTVKHN